MSLINWHLALNLILQIRTALLKNQVQMTACVYVVGRLVDIIQVYNIGVRGELLQNSHFTQHTFGSLFVRKGIEYFLYGTFLPDAI